MVYLIAILIKKSGKWSNANNLKDNYMIKNNNDSKQ